MRQHLSQNELNFNNKCFITTAETCLIEEEVCVREAIRHDRITPEAATHHTSLM